uniref:Uncharacterized protein n=1 Tax=Bracon brevicornis TaxID=1563983 RepID=A0A6V7KTR0_9HYME
MPAPAVAMPREPQPNRDDGIDEELNDFEPLGLVPGDHDVPLQNRQNERIAIEGERMVEIPRMPDVVRVRIHQRIRQLIVDHVDGDVEFQHYVHFDNIMQENGVIEEALRDIGDISDEEFFGDRMGAVNDEKKEEEDELTDR